jgi:hypothetical protein
MRKALGFALAFVSGACFGAVLAWETSKGAIENEVKRQTSSLFLAADIAETEFTPLEQWVPEEAVEHAEVVNSTNYQVDIAQPNDGIHHISEIEYEHEESFDKCVVEIFLNEDLPVFLFNSIQVEDWFSHLGETIVLTGDETKDNETFYVRNHNLRTDYEVTWGQP